MNFQSPKYFVRKNTYGDQAAAWLFALPLALALNLPATAAQEIAQSSTETSAEKQPEVRVGELSFKVTSLRISRVKPNKYSTHDVTWATLSLTITNHGKDPVALNYKDKSASFVNEHGYAWRERHDTSGRDISGLPVETNNKASVDYVIDPSGQLSATIPLFLELAPNQSTGTAFNFQAVFSSFKDMGEGKLKKLRAYPVSFIGLKPSSMPDTAAIDLKDGTNNIEIDLKNAIGKFFRR